jgi:hypothetical protein
MTGVELYDVNSLYPRSLKSLVGELKPVVDEDFKITPTFVVTPNHIYFDDCVSYSEKDVAMMEAFYWGTFPRPKRPSLIHNGKKPKK